MAVALTAFLMMPTVGVSAFAADPSDNTGGSSASTTSTSNAGGSLDGVSDGEQSAGETSGSNTPSNNGNSSESTEASSTASNGIAGMSLDNPTSTSNGTTSGEPSGASNSNSGIATVADEGNTTGSEVKTFTASDRSGNTYEVSIDYSGCEGVSKDSFSDVGFTASATNAPTKTVSALSEYCTDKKVTYVGCHMALLTFDKMSDETRADLVNAPVTITVTNTNNSAIVGNDTKLGNGNTLLGAAYGSETVTDKGFTVVSNGTTNDGGHNSITITGAFGNLPDDSTYNKYLAIMSANSTQSEELYTEEELNENGVWLYSKDQAYNEADGTWTIYDCDPKNNPEQNARVKTVVKLPQGTTVSNDYYMFVSEITGEDGTARFPSKETVESVTGEVNDYQVYSIHWARKTSQLENGKPLYDMNPSSVLGGDKAATITMKYLKTTDDSVVLNGNAGERKLLVYNLDPDFSGQGTATLEDIAGKVTDVTVNGETDMDSTCYTGFTFETNNAGPYVFVSKKLPRYYVKELKVKNISDGTEPWDSNSDPGNDANDSNKIVRSYDKITYLMGFNLGSRESHIVDQSVQMHFEMEIDQQITAAQFDLSSMTWLGNTYKIEYLDKDGNTVLTREFIGGKDVYKDAQGKETSINALVSGSGSGKTSYTVASGQIVTQRLTGTTTLTAGSGGSLAEGERSLTAALLVRNADNGTKIKPTFKVWVEGNEENYGSEGTVGGAGSDTVRPAEPQEGNSTEAAPVTVSAQPSFNLQLKKNNDCSYKSWFNFATGEEATGNDLELLEEYGKLEGNYGVADPAQFKDESGNALSAEIIKQLKDYRYGRITGYGLTLQLYPDVENDGDRAAKGLKGQALPVGDITFDLNFTSKVGTQSDVNQYTPILWDYNENVEQWNNEKEWEYDDPYIGENGKLTIPSNPNGNGGRRIYWNQEYRTSYGKGAAPFNYKFYQNGCYYGGDWVLVDENGKELKDKDSLAAVASPAQVTGNASNTTYHFKVSGYDFDFSDQKFPIEDAGNSGTVAAYDQYARCFSAGYVQVLSIMPRTQKEATVDLELTATANNLTLTTRGDQELKADSSDNTKTKHEVNAGDNSKTDKIDLYRPGGPTKGNSFNGWYTKDGTIVKPNAVGNSYLGTGYWTTAYDCNTYAGSNIYLMGYGLINAGSDFRLRQMNLLQLFDSRALSVRTTDDDRENDPIVINQDIADGDDKGTTTFLYAADPGYPRGYDTNADGVLEYMNTVREEDLVYSDKLNSDGTITVTIDGQSQNLTCVGVLAETRGANIMSGKYQTVRIPVHVNGEDTDLVNKTVATVNTVRIWSDPNALKTNAGGATDTTYASWVNGVWNPTTQKNELEGYTVPSGYDAATGEYSWELANGGGATSKTDVYVKTEYENGNQVSGTHAGGVNSGNSLLLLNYKSNVKISVENGTESQGTPSFKPGNSGDTAVKYELSNIQAKADANAHVTSQATTHLTIKTVLDEDAKTGELGGRISYQSGSAVMMVGGTPYKLSEDSSAPTEVSFTDSKGKPHTIKVYVNPASDGSSFSVEIMDAPIGVELPNITFEAPFAALSKLNNNDTIRTATYISGTSDKRAYNQTEGNTDNKSVKIIKESGSYIEKSVSPNVVELNGEEGSFTYTVTYTNASGASAIDKLYLYDLLPCEGDGNNSNVAGSIGLSDVSAELTGGSESAASSSAAPKIVAYYSTTPYGEIANAVASFGGTGNATEKASNIEAMLAGDNPKFAVLGTYENGTFSYDSEVLENGNPKQDIFSKITCVYLRIENMQPDQSAKLTLTVAQNADVVANNRYKNVAYCWNADTASSTAADPLKTNLVETITISRSISGVVWNDANANGVRDEGESLVGGVQCDLFVKGENGAYTRVTQDIAGTTIGTEVTGSNGAYSFERLPAGNYVVAFKNADGETPFGDTTEATSYQINGSNDANTNDGVSASQVMGLSNGYNFAIAYSLSGTGESAQASPIELHSIKELNEKRIALDGGVERIAHQDLGITEKGNLSISKTIKEANGAELTDSNYNDEFSFDITANVLSGSEGSTTPLAGSFMADITTSGASTQDGGILASIAQFASGLFGIQPASADVTTTTVVFTGGKATVKLKANQTITIKGLPVGCSVSVAENQQASAPGYTVTSPTGGSYSKQIEANETAACPFENTFGYEPVTLAPEVTKTIDAHGITVSKGETFTFKIAASNNNPVGAQLPSRTTTSTTLNAASPGITENLTGTAKFEDITFTRPGTYNFTISENVPEDKDKGPFKYDTSTWNLKVVVTAGASGADESKLTTTATYTKNGVVSGSPTFTNGYAPKAVSFTPIVNKDFTSDSADRPKDSNGNSIEQTFRFNLSQVAEEEYKGVTMPQNGTTAQVTGAGSSSAGGNVSFGSIKFEWPGTYKFKISEVKGGATGYTYDENPWTLTVVVTDEGGTLKAVGSYERTVDNQKKESSGNNAVASFTNAYNPEPTTMAPSVKKKLTGKTGANATKSFEFELTAAANTATESLDSLRYVEVGSDGTETDKSWSANTKLTATATADASGSFNAIKFMRAGEYKFAITETETGGNGFTYDKSPWTLTVQVEDEDGKLVVTSKTYAKDGASGDDATSENFATFKNEYEASGSLELKGSKTMTGREFKSGDSFTFTVSGDKDTPQPTRDGITITTNDDGSWTGTVVIDPTSDSSADVDFGTVNFDQSHAGTDAGGKTYTYTFAEKNGSIGGVKYDTTLRTLNVTVKDKGNGELEIIPTLASSQGGEPTTADARDTAGLLTWKNEYAPGSATYSIPVTKRITGRDFVQGDSFRFNISGFVEGGVAGESAPMPQKDGAAVTSVGITPTSGQSASVDFGSITFDKDNIGKTYVYTITEAAPEDAGENRTKDGLTYDGSTKTVKIKVEDANQDGGDLALTVTDDKGNTLPSDGVAFENDYNANPVNFTPTVSKQFSEGRAALPADATFTFKLAAENEAAREVLLQDYAAATITKHADGSADTVAGFGALTFTEPGTYTFAITEKDDGKNGFGYDDARWILTVKVDDNNKGQLVINQSETGYKRSDASEGAQLENAATFMNTYSVTPVTVQLGVSKQFSENSQARPGNEEKTFAFQLAQIAGADYSGVDMPQDATATVPGAGDATFSAITFNQAGEYDFQITEVAPNPLPTGYAYDGTVWVAHVSVTDTNGTLGTTVTYHKQSEEGIGNTNKPVFTNIYIPVFPDSAAVPVSAGKQLTGITDVIKDTEFAFQLAADGGNPQGAVLKQSGSEDVSLDGTGESPAAVTRTIKAGETVNFGSIAFTQAGTYNYTLTEVAGAENNGFSYDSNIWKLNVEVVDNSGTLEATPTWSHVDADGNIIPDADTDRPATPFFHNAYNAATTLSFAGTKLMSGRDFQVGDEFTFAVTGTSSDGGEAPMPQKDGEQINSVTIKPTEGTSQSVSFGEVSFTQEDADKTYTYTFTEAQPENGLGGVTYDTEVRTISVYVRDNGNGTLALLDGGANGDEITSESVSAMLQWTNAYGTEGALELNATKLMDGRAFQEGDEFTFTVVGERVDGSTGSATKAPLPQDAEGATQDAVTIAPVQGTSAPVSFGTIRFSLSDVGNTYRYTIAEAQDGSGANGVTYDGESKVVLVKVADSAAHDGAIVLTVTDGEGKALPSEGIVFTNAYEAESVSFVPAVAKRLSDESAALTEDATFAFELAAANDAAKGVLPEGYAAATITKHADGSADTVAGFGALTFTEPGTYAFAITEKDDGAKGFTYDKGVWTLTVAVKDDLRGKLYVDTAETGYKLNDAVGTASADAATFTNVYTPPTPSEPGNPSSPEEPITPTALSQTGDGIPGAVMVVCGVIAAALVVAAASLLRIRRNAKKGAHTR